ncbi:S41 family peptidase [Aureibacillus halotolerans]|uniref:S41 family peptidase n=1 Tax=Aureibacillus halotolerans TaxID=1508390 RepID=UPI003C7D028E
MKMSAAVALMILCLFLGAGGTYWAVGDTMKEKAAAYDKLASSQDSTATEQADNGEDAALQFQKLQQVYNSIEANYVEDVSGQELMDGAIQGMVGSLEDDFSAYMDVESSQQLMESLESSFEGIGAEVSMMDGRVTIVSPIKDSPAEKEGLMPNDKIISVDGEPLDGLSLQEAVNKIRGEKGSVVTLEILRAGSSETVDVEVTRDTIPIETVYSRTETVDGKAIGVIEITSFAEETAADFAAQLEALEAEDIEGLVIDVRGNPGGYLQSVVDIAGEIIPKDDPFLQEENRNGEKTPYFTDLTDAKPYPIVGLIDRGSASASEILAGALKENAGYELVGESSFGKGTVQKVIPLEDGSSLKLTMQKWLTPDGNWIHEKGIEPTIPVEQPAYYYTHPLAIEEPLKQDSTGSAIENAQLMLKGLGFDPGRTDGYFSTETTSAVKAFQQENNIEASGELTAETGELLQQSLVEKIRSQEGDKQLDKALDVVSQ